MERPARALPIVWEHQRRRRYFTTYPSGLSLLCRETFEHTARRTLVQIILIFINAPNVRPRPWAALTVGLCDHGIAHKNHPIACEATLIALALLNTGLANSFASGSFAQINPREKDRVDLHSGE